VKPLSVREKLLKQKIRVFNNLDFAEIFGLSSYQTEYNLRQLTDEGLLTRLKRGLYVLKTDPPSEEEIANALYKPSYISFEYALAHYNIIPEMTYHVTSATTKPTRLFTTDNTSFSYNTIKREAYTGYILSHINERRFYIAEPEKALVDYMYLAALGQRSLIGVNSLNDRMNITLLNKEKIAYYVKMYNWSKLNKLVKEVL